MSKILFMWHKMIAHSLGVKKESLELENRISVIVWNVNSEQIPKVGSLITKTFAFHTDIRISANLLLAYAIRTTAFNKIFDTGHKFFGGLIFFLM